MAICRLLLLVVMASIAAVVLGCGGGGDDAPAAGPPSKAEFIEQANAICERESATLAEDALEFERRRARSKPEPGSIDMPHLVYLPVKENQVWRIEQLRVPSGEGKRIEEVLDATRSAIDSAAVDLKLPSIAAAERYFGESDKLYRAYGLDSCANKSTRSAGKGV
jgi:hypothetical protein